MVFYCIRPIDGFYVATSCTAERIVSVTDDAFGRILPAIRCHSFERVLRRRIDHNVEVFPFSLDVFFAPFEQAANTSESIASYYLDVDILHHLAGSPAVVLGNELDLVLLLRDKRATKDAVSDLGIPVPELRPMPTVDSTSELVVLRPSTSDGGSGIRLSTQVSHDQVARFAYAEEYILGPSFNVHFTVGPDRIRVYEPSVQIIGADVLAPEPFAYCGGDFATARSHDLDVLKMLGEYTAEIAVWLAGRGYRGAGGVDFVVREGRCYFLEINPRMQCSSFSLSVALAEDRQPTIDQLHCAAWLEPEIGVFGAPEFVTTSRVPLTHMVLIHDRPSGVVCAAPPDGEYDGGFMPVRLFDEATPGNVLRGEADLWFQGAPEVGTCVERGAQLVRVLTGRRVLDSDAIHLSQEWREFGRRLREQIAFDSETR